MPHSDPSLAIELNAVIVAVDGVVPKIMVVPPMALPSGPFGTEHRTLEQGLRGWVQAQSGLRLGYVEQLYTFADKDRTAQDTRMVSIGYLALTRMTAARDEATWSDWYEHFPWEDHRAGVPPITTAILSALAKWKNDAPDTATRKARDIRIAINFPKEVKHWNEELVLPRYELLWEAGLIEETPHRQRNPVSIIKSLAMAHDHRRILATGIARLRAKIKYRPVVFELMPDRFTLLQLQTTVEALAGLRLHKQNFRRLVQAQGLVEETTGTQNESRGRPAKLFAFRREVLRERAAVGTKLPRTV